MTGDLERSTVIQGLETPPPHPFAPETGAKPSSVSSVCLAAMDDFQLTMFSAGKISSSSPA
jgi:hypothetical protein